MKVSEIKKKNLPDINDDFAKDLGFDTMSEMRDKVKERLHAMKKDHIEKLHKATIISQIIATHNFDVPETLLKKEMESIAMQESMSQKELPETAAQEDSTGKDPETMQAELEQKALMNVRASIILNSIGGKEGVTVTDSELDERINMLAQRLSASPEAVRNFYSHKEGSLDSLRHSIFEDKVLDLLLSKAQLEKGE